MARRAHASARWCPLDAMRLGTTRAHGTQLRGFAHPTLNLQELRRVAAKYLALVIRMQVQVLDYGNARALEHLERRSVGAENEAIGADGFERAARRRHVIAGRFQLHHFEIMAGRMLDQHRLVGTEE